jgi:hypothetical protein
MIVRIWRTQIDQARAGEYRDFAHSRSLPMFRAQPGFAGALFAAQRAERVVITLWCDLASVKALDRSHTYHGGARVRRRDAAARRARPPC